jgi:hypothetical protein
MRKLLLILLVLVYSNARAQFITCIPDSAAHLGAAWQTVLDTLRANPAYESITVVELGDLFEEQENGVLQFSVPGYSIKARVRFMSAMPIDSPAVPYVEYVWSGDPFEIMQDSNNVDTAYYEGSVNFYKKDGHITGTIKPFLSDDVFELTSLGTSGKSVLIKYDVEHVSSFNECTSDVSEDTVTYEKPTDCNHTIRVLVLWTTKAHLAVPNINDCINTAMGHLNGAAANSGLYGTVYFQLAGAFHVPEITESATIGATKEALRLSPGIQYRRNNQTADIVILLTDGNFTDYGDSYIGLSNPKAYAVVEADKSNLAYTFAHEIGHIMGAMHQQESIFLFGYDNTPGKGHGYDYGHAPWLVNYHTHSDIMRAMVGNGNERWQAFSSPNVIAHGNPLGIATTNDVAGTFADNYCTVANFRPDAFIPFSCTITGPNAALTGATVPVTVTPLNGIPFFYYTWYYSTDGGTNWTYYTNTSNSGASLVNFTMPNTPGLIVKVHALSQVGEMVDVFKTISNPAIGQICCQNNNTFRTAKPDNELVSIPESRMRLQVSPNPATSETHIKCFIPTDELNGDEKIVVTDLLGRQVMEVAIDKSVYNYTMNIGNLAAGTYLVKLINGNQSNTQKITVIK